ncbi:MAG: type I-C CRISPR-associated protein Cas8c/Csd1 [Chloroflexota bacterium]
MLLRRLVQYSERLSLPPALYAETPIRYRIRLDSAGRLLSPRPIDTADGRDRSKQRGERMAAPQVTRSSGIKPLLLADNGEYTLGIAREKSKPERVHECHTAYKALVRRCAVATRDPQVRAVADWLESDGAAHLDLPDDFDAGGLVTFAVDDGYLVELPSVQAFWLSENEPSAGIMQCVVCGEVKPVLARLQGKLKGLPPPAQTSGTSIISANAPAFESYGQPASLVAPTCASCGERFTKAANALILQEQSHLRIGDAVYVFWTRDAVPFSPFTVLSNPSPADVHQLMSSVRGRGGSTAAAGFDDTPFYAVALSGSGGRAVVRDWIDTTVGNVRQNLVRWFHLQEIASRDGDDRPSFGVFALAASTVRDASKELKPPVVRALLRVALAGAQPDFDLLQRAVARCKADGQVTRPRAAIIKLVLGGLHTWEEGQMVELDEQNLSPAYRCGRLLAVIEEIQRAALGDVNTTVVDRFYGSAASSPGAVFQRLLAGARPHLAKLRRDRPPTYYALQARLEDVLAGIPSTGFPRTLTLPDQGLFALGFYHQRAFDRSQARANSERRRSTQSAESSAHESEDQE